MSQGWTGIFRGWPVLLLLVVMAPPVYGNTRDPDGDDIAYEKPPAPWPSNRNVREGERGCWQPPSAPFSRVEALKVVTEPLRASLTTEDATFGKMPDDLHVAGMIRVPTVEGCEGELTLVQLGPRKENTERMEAVVRSFLVLTSHGRLCWKQTLGDSAVMAGGTHYRLSRVPSRFEKQPLVMVFTDSGANTRGFFYDIERITAARAETLWTEGFDDGHTGSTDQAYGWSVFDFSDMRSRSANQFAVFNTSGLRRQMFSDQPVDLRPKYKKFVFRWEPGSGQFTKVLEAEYSREGKVITRTGFPQGRCPLVMSTTDERTSVEIRRWLRWTVAW